MSPDSLWVAVQRAWLAGDHEAQWDLLEQLAPWGIPVWDCDGHPATARLPTADLADRAPIRID